MQNKWNQDHHRGVLGGFFQSLHQFLVLEQIRGGLCSESPGAGFEETSHGVVHTPIFLQPNSGSDGLQLNSDGLLPNSNTQ